MALCGHCGDSGVTTSDPGNGMEPSTAPASPYLCHGQEPCQG